MAEVPPEIGRLGDERAAARAAKDFTRADAIRDELTAAGWTVVDAPDGTFALEPLARPDTFDRAPAADVSLHWVCEGWAEDVGRAIAGFREHQEGRRLQLVVADVTGQPGDRWGSDVQVVAVPPDAGWAAARNAGLDRSVGDVVVTLDPSVEPTGDVLTPIVSALNHPEVGVVGPYGIVTRDLREFEAAPGPGPCDAIEGYLMAFRRDVLREVGGFDERFRWYRSADIEWSFRVKDAGYRVEVVEVPVTKHEHRMWAATSPEDRARLSKRNFYRFLDRFRDRWDLVESGPPDG